MASVATPTEGEATAAAADTDWCLPTDVVVEILLRLPTTKRWRLRLVCRHWRDVILERTPAPARPTALAFALSSADSTAMSALAYAIDDDPAGGRCREVWRSNNVRPVRYYDYARRRDVYDREFDTVMVGTRNGVLCLCDNTVPGGAISLANPATGETLALPPLPCSSQWKTWGTTISRWHKAYAFAHDPDAWRYSVVHVPSFFDRNGGFAALQVLTIAPGDEPSSTTSWRLVPVMNRTAATCCLDAGLVAIEAALHWVTQGTERVVSFDLEAERVASTLPLPTPAGRGYRWQLTEVHGRLAVVNYSYEHWWDNPEKTHVWVLGGGGGGGRNDQQGWSRWYSVQVHGVLQRLASPQFAYGEHVLTTEAHRRGGDWEGVLVHRMAPGRLRCREVRSVRISEQAPGVRVSGIRSSDGDSAIRILGVFAYVETKESLGAYKL